MPATRLLNTIAQRVVDLQTDKRLTFPPITRDFTPEEVGNLLTTLLGETLPAPEVAELKEQIRDGKAEVESLKRDISDLEDELSRERNR